MKTIEDITFNERYSHASTFFLFLYDRYPHLSIPIELPHADSLTCIRPFHDPLHCQQHVDNHRQKMIILFTTDKKFLNRYRNPNDIDPNLCEIFIYCNTMQGHLEMIRLRNHYGTRIQKVIMVEDLDFRLLLAGADYINIVAEEFKDNDDLHDQFLADGKRIGEAMAEYFGSRATRLSEEETER